MGLRNGEMSFQSMGEMGEGFCPNFLQTFLENIDRRSCDDGGWELILVFHNPHREIPTLSFDQSHAAVREL